MANNYFQFKQFRIEQNHAAMRVNTDGVLLGAWSNISNAHRILDIGTGTGLIALMLAQRNENSTIDAVEIEEGAANDALFNFQNSKWSNRLKLHHTSIQNYAEQCAEKYDLIVCNPPYFEQSLKSATHHKQLARHTDSLAFETLFQCANKLLLPNGTFALILPIETEKKIKSIAANHKLFVSRITRVKSNALKPCIRMLIEFQYNSKTQVESELCIYNVATKNYTNEFIQLTHSFYLNH